MTNHSRRALVNVSIRAQLLPLGISRWRTA